jgi:hypothetical protein
MKRFVGILLAGTVCLLVTFAQKAPSPFVGRWDFNTAPQSANWLGVTEKDGTLEIWFQPTGGNVRQIKEFKLDGSHLMLNIDHANEKNPGMTWDLDAAGDKLTGVQKRGSASIALTGVRAPALKRDPPAAWSDPEPLFDGKDLAGWEPTDAAHNNWVVEDGDLVNKAHGSNLRGTRKFDDFKLHIEFNCPDDGNSGVYLRGRYEVQVEYEPLDRNPPERRIGSIYGFLAPAVTVPRKPGTWESFDVTLVGRTVTVIHDGILTIDRKEIPGITGGALDANEGQPGPIYIQGDHTGGLRFRNIRISVPKR